MGVPERAKGQVVAGRFRLVGQIGRGGMGSVWLARHLTLNVDVAVKFMDAAFQAGDETMLKRFQKEAEAAASIQSPNVVKILDFGKDQTGRPYLAMELLKGEELEQRLEREGPLSLDLMKRVVVETCKGLAAAHAAGVIHRDLKPENVFLAADPHAGADESGAHRDVAVKLLDFGIARADRELSGTGNLTITGQLLGTPMFMSPEQALGRKDIDGRSDLYSLGVVAYKCLTGQPPYEESETVGEILVSITTKEPRDPTQLRKDLPPAVVTWLKKALAKERDDRYQTADEMAQAFVEACDVRKMHVSFSGLDVDDTSRPRIDFDAVSERAAQAMAHTAPGATKGKSDAPAASAAATASPVKSERPPAPAPKKRESSVMLYVIAALAVTAGAGVAYVLLHH
jgi:serine/threonine protein kinase